MWKAVKTCIRKMVVFSGRASRAEFWWFFLACMIASLAISGLGLALLLSLSNPPDFNSTAAYGIGLLMTVFGLAANVALLSAAWRRLHDSGLRGWLVLIPVVPGIGGYLAQLPLQRQLEASLAAAGGDITQLSPEAIAALMPSGNAFAMLAVFNILGLISSVVLLVLLIRRSQSGPNRYGPNPNEVQP